MRRLRRWPRIHQRALGIIALLLCGCGKLSAQQPDFSNLVFVGDSLTAGFRSGSLTADSQQSGYAAWLARRINTILFQPLVDPRFLPEFRLSESQFPFTVQRPAGDLTLFPRLAPFIYATNLAVPGYTLGDALTYVPDTSTSQRNLFPLIVFGIPTLQSPFAGRTQLGMAELFQPSFMVVWLGNNDALGAALTPLSGRLTPPEVFRRQYTELVGRLRQLGLAYGTKIIVANVPDVTAVASLTSRDKLARYLRRDVGEVAARLGVREGDFVTADSFRFVADIMSGRLPGPLPRDFILTAEKVVTIRAGIAQYNAIIRELSQAYSDFRFPVMDAYAVFNDLVANGATIGNIRLTTDFLGGIFGLDGTHPTSTGYALMTNYFVDAINGFYGAAIPRLSEAELLAIMAKDPLAPSPAKRADDSPAVLSMSENDYQELLNRMLGGERPERPE
ncbi:MAG: SGNH/GDSL hydrolase family protein [Acidobacteria bacterium]|nr:SGNH/GDSL hydrolase family protein [Acidobacteriota bacterium]